MNLKNGRISDYRPFVFSCISFLKVTHFKKFLKGIKKLPGYDHKSCNQQLFMLKRYQGILHHDDTEDRNGDQ